MRKILSLLTAILFAGSMMATDVAVTIHASSGDYYAKTHSWQNATQYDQVELDENITANRIGTGNNGKYYQDWRFYTNGSNTGSFSIDAAAGYELQSVTFTYATQNNGALYMGETQLTSQTAVAVSGQQAVFQCKNTNDATNGQVRLTAIAVTYQEAVAPLATVKTVYCKNVQSWWNADGAAVAVYAWTGDVKNAAWPGVRMEAVTGEEGIWKADIDTAKYAKIIFTRVNATGDIADWGAKTADLTIPADKDLYTITSTTPVWGNPGVTGEWSVYGEEPTPVDPPTPTAKFYVTGNAALVGQDKEWNPAAVASMADTLELNLEANIDYVLKVTLNGAWEGENNVKGYNELTEKTAGLLDISNDHNIGFKLAEAGVVKVVYIAAANEQPEVFKLIGDFYVEPVEPTAKFYVTGNAALVGQDKEWNPAAVASMADTLELNLEANIDYVLKVTLNGAWEGENNVKGYNELTEKTAGLLDISNDHNIGFKLNEAGVVKVVYIAAANEQPEVFKLIGDFYVEPVEPTAKFYVTGNAALVGQDKEWNPAAVASMADTLELNLEANIDYVLKVTLNGAWEGENNVKGYNELTEKTAGLLDISNDHNIGFKLNEAGVVKVVYIAAANEQPEVFKLIGNFYVEPVEPTAKFYVTGNAALVGQDKEWNPAAVASMADTLELNLEANIDYVLKVTLNGAWEGENNVKGYNELTEKTAGLLDISNDHNIGFKLNEAGVVKVVYIAAANEQPEVFKLIGDFYVEPVEPTAKFYVTGNAALVGQDKEWNPAAVASMADTLELNLEANVDYILKVTLNGAWEGENNVKGYNELTEKTAGLLDISNDHNIGFKLAEAGVVKVVYIAAANEQPEVFKLIGDFYVAPPADPTVAVIGDMTEWEAQLPFELSEDKTYATLSNDNIKKGTYAFKLIVNGEWRSNGYEYHREFPGAAGITGNVEANMTVNIDVEGAYTFVWTFANDSFAIVYPEKPEPQLANGYYLVGLMNDWTPAAEYFLEQNPDNEAEYELDINLNVNDEIKVVYVENDAIVTWYPKEGNYIVDDNHDGATTMYFRPEYNSDWSAFGGYFYIVPTSTVGFDNVDADAKAIKQVINGKLFILRGDKTYTVDGQIVR